MASARSIGATKRRERTILVAPFEVFAKDAEIESDSSTTFARSGLCGTICSLSAL
jgi:hypothetical protein